VKIVLAFFIMAITNEHIQLCTEVPNKHALRRAVHGMLLEVNN
jgi:hypothetical protein